jgi:hypothetical protein
MYSLKTNLKKPFFGVYFITSSFFIDKRTEKKDEIKLLGIA